MSFDYEIILQFKNKFFRLYNLSVDGQNYALTPEHLNIKKYTKKIHVQEITPSVIEPSYGIGRIMYALLEHSFRQREGDEQRTFLAFKPLVAPIKCSVLPISANDTLIPVMDAVKEELSRFEMSYKVVSLNYSFDIKCF